jgi:hypothetical protein
MPATQTLVAGILPLVYILWDFYRPNILNCRDPDNCGTRGTLPGPDVMGLLSEKGVVRCTERGFSTADEVATRLNLALAHDPLLGMVWMRRKPPFF